jgi:hypothetical protein
MAAICSCHPVLIIDMTHITLTAATDGVSPMPAYQSADDTDLAYTCTFQARVPLSLSYVISASEWKSSDEALAVTLLVIFLNPINPRKSSLRTNCR